MYISHDTHTVQLYRHDQISTRHKHYSLLVCKLASFPGPSPISPTKSTMSSYTLAPTDYSHNIITVSVNYSEHKQPGKEIRL